jgi:hypothetical protein
MPANEIAHLIGAGIRGPAPYANSYLNLEPGVCVLYGINGAGKTRLLNAIGSAAGDRRTRLDALPLSLRATRPAGALPGSHLWDADPDNVESYLYAFMPPTDGYDAWRDGLNAAAVTAWSLRMRVARSLEIEPDDWLGEEAATGDAVRTLVALELPPRWRETALVGEVADQHLFALSRGRELHVAARISDDTPHLRNVWAENERFAQGLEEQSDARNTFASYYLSRLWRHEGDGWPLLLMRSAFDVAFGDDSAPAWVPEVITNAGECAIEPIRLLDEVPVDLAAATMASLRTPDEPKLGPRSVLVAEHGSVAIASDVAARARSLGAVASEIGEALLLDAPVLECRLADPQAWATSPPLSWVAFDRPSMTWVPLDALGQAQRRWCIFAVKLAIDEMNKDRTDLVIIDEPEAALHARAERHLVAGLRELSVRLDAPVVVATHSAAMLNAQDFRLHHVDRDADGLIVARAMPSAIRRELDILGLDAADALQLTRVFLVVEGHHDQLIFEHLLGDELDAERAVVIPMHGATHLNDVLDSQMIFEFTSAAALIVLDNIEGARAKSVCEEVHELTRAGNPEGAEQVLNERLSGKRSGEERFLRQFLSKAVATGRFDRVSAASLVEADILEYLPVDALVPGATSWGELHERHAQHRGTQFKPWLIAEHGADLSDSSLLAAIERMDEVPHDFVMVLEECRQLSRVGLPAPPTA